MLAFAWVLLAAVCCTSLKLYRKRTCQNIQVRFSSTQAYQNCKRKGVNWGVIHQRRKPLPQSTEVGLNSQNQVGAHPPLPNHGSPQSSPVACQGKARLCPKAAEGCSERRARPLLASWPPTAASGSLRLTQSPGFTHFATVWYFSRSKQSRKWNHWKLRDSALLEIWPQGSQVRCWENKILCN